MRLNDTQIMWFYMVLLEFLNICDRPTASNSIQQHPTASDSHGGTSHFILNAVFGAPKSPHDPRNGHDESTGPSGVIMAGASPMNSSMILWL